MAVIKEKPSTNSSAHRLQPHENMDGPSASDILDNSCIDLAAIQHGYNAMRCGPAVRYCKLFWHAVVGLTTFLRGLIWKELLMRPVLDANYDLQK